MSVLLPTGRFSPHFTMRELVCECCGKYNPLNMVYLVEALEALRTAYGPIPLICGHRCEAHNSRIGGQRDSLHLYSLAVDIRVGYDSDRYRLVKHLQMMGWSGIGVGSGMVHADRRHKIFPLAKSVMWSYPLPAGKLVS